MHFHALIRVHGKHAKLISSSDIVKNVFIKNELY